MMLYAVITFTNEGMEIFKTTDHAKMLDQVRKVSAECKQYKVLRKVLPMQAVIPPTYRTTFKNLFFGKYG